MSVPELRIDLSIPEIAELVMKNNLLHRRLMKFDVIDDKLYRMIWNEEALVERKKIQQAKYKETYELKKIDILEKAKQKYREKHPITKEHKQTSDEKLPYYLTKKLTASFLKRGDFTTNCSTYQTVCNPHETHE